MAVAAVACGTSLGKFARKWDRVGHDDSPQVALTLWFPLWIAHPGRVIASVLDMSKANNLLTPVTG